VVYTRQRTGWIRLATGGFFLSERPARRLALVSRSCRGHHTIKCLCRTGLRLHPAGRFRAGVNRQRRHSIPRDPAGHPGQDLKQFADQWGLPGDLWYPSMYEPDRWDLEEGPPPPIPSCVPEFFGDTILVNGAVYPFVDVEPRRYRFRVLNGSNARFYALKLVYAQSSTFPGSTEPDVTKLGPPFLQIGTEGGFLPSPVPLNYRPNAPTLLLAPAERADLIIDFSQVPPGSRLILYNDAPAPFPGPDERDDYYPGNPKNPTPSTPGYGPNTRALMQFRVGPLVGSPDPPAAPLTLPAIIPLYESAATTVRDLTLNEDFDGYGRLIQRLGTNVRLSAGTFARNFGDTATERPQAGIPRSGASSISPVIPTRSISTW
jgi:spore coat protein A